MQNYLTFLGPVRIDTEQMKRFDSGVKERGMKSECLFTVELSPVVRTLGAHAQLICAVWISTHVAAISRGSGQLRWTLK